MSYVELFVELHSIMDTPQFKQTPLGWSGWYSVVLNLIKKHIPAIEGLGFYLPMDDHLQIGPYIAEFGIPSLLDHSDELVGSAVRLGRVEQSDDLTRMAVPLHDREQNIKAVLYLFCCGQGILDGHHKKNLLMLMAILQDQLY